MEASDSSYHFIRFPCPVADENGDRVHPQGQSDEHHPGGGGVSVEVCPGPGTQLNIWMGSNVKSDQEPT